MLNVLLADDETRTLHHLMTGVPWFQLGMEVCCTASNGSEALAFIESHPIDILITDIRMPGMDGLELCQRVRERYHDMSIILLTGYADFEYARRGIELQVTDYCLKPIDTEQLTATLLYARGTGAPPHVQTRCWILSRKATLKKLRGHFLIWGSKATVFTSPAPLAFTILNRR